jgi:hydroxyatrazine ethylaminohydrolase
MKTVLVKNAKAIVTCDDMDRVYYDTDMLIQGPEIIQIGKNIQADNCEVIDAQDKFIYPGLINTHHHFFQAFARNLMSIDMPNISLIEWLTSVYSIFEKIDSDVIYYASLTSMADLIKHGCTTAFDHQYCYTPTTGKTPIDRQMKAAKQLGFRLHAGRGTNTLSQSEGSMIPDAMVESVEEYIEDCKRVIDLYHDPSPFSMRQIVLAPCQPINSSKETFTETIELARKHKLHMHTHLGEGENNIMVERHGKRSLAWCEEIGFTGPDVWYAHGFEFEPDEYEVLGLTGSGVSHCPLPAAVGAGMILDFKAMQEKNVLISLGCDGQASNDGSNLLDSLRIAYVMQAFYSNQRGGCVTPYELLKIATINGAKTLGRKELGSLEEGKAADLFMVDTGTLELAGALHDPKNMLAKIGVTDSVWLTMINGETVFREGTIMGVDERKLAHEGEEVCTRVLRNNSDAYPKDH